MTKEQTIDNIIRQPPLHVVSMTGDATPERLAKGDSYVADGVRVMRDSLLDRLAEKGHLYPDAGVNAVLKMAGEKYYEDWYGAGLSTLIAIDYGKVSGGGGGGSGGGVSQIQTRCRESHNAARKALPPKYRKPVELVLLEGQSDLVAVGKAITGAKDRVLARAVAIERFTAGLYLLGLHYALLK